VVPEVGQVPQLEPEVSTQGEDHPPPAAPVEPRQESEPQVGDGSTTGEGETGEAVQENIQPMGEVSGQEQGVPDYDDDASKREAVPAEEIHPEETHGQPEQEETDTEPVQQDHEPAAEAIDQSEPMDQGTDQQEHGGMEVADDAMLPETGDHDAPSPERPSERAHC